MTPADVSDVIANISAEYVTLELVIPVEVI